MTENPVAELLQIEPAHCWIAVRDRATGALLRLLDYSPHMPRTYETVYRVASGGTYFEPFQSGSNPGFSLSAPSGDRRTHRQRFEAYIGKRGKHARPRSIDSVTIEALCTDAARSAAQRELYAGRM